MKSANPDNGMVYRKKPGRKKSPRIFQLHPKVMPVIGAAIAKEAEQKGLTQGQLIEAMWEAYCKPNKSIDNDRKTRGL